jgi:hypothetical protein
MLVRGLAVLAVAAFVAIPASPRASAAPAPRVVVVAQASPAPGQPDVTGHLPSATWLLVVIAVGLAAYVSFRLGQKRETGPRRREGPIGRAMSGEKTPGTGRRTPA